MGVHHSDSRMRRSPLIAIFQGTQTFLSAALKLFLATDLSGQTFLADWLSMTNLLEALNLDSYMALNFSCNNQYNLESKWECVTASGSEVSRGWGTCPSWPHSLKARLKACLEAFLGLVPKCDGTNPWLIILKVRSVILSRSYSKYIVGHIESVI